MQFYFIGAGKGVGTEKLNSFDSALNDTGVGNYNLVRVSSILPPNSTRNAFVEVKEGEPLHVAYAEITDNKIGKRISAAVAVGLPKKTNNVGVIMEYEGECTKRESEYKVVEMVKEAMECRNIEIKDIEIASSECYISDAKYHTAFAAVALW